MTRTYNFFSPDYTIIRKVIIEVQFKFHSSALFLIVINIFIKSKKTNNL